MSNTITLLILIFQTKSVYRGKVREVYNINDELLVMVATDRLSAFDVVLPKNSIRSNSKPDCYKFMELTGYCT
jgi:phosphoribosylaminoimidazole-succinocarboxamide synthase